MGRTDKALQFWTTIEQGSAAFKECFHGAVVSSHREQVDGIVRATKSALQQRQIKAVVAVDVTEEAANEAADEMEGISLHLAHQDNDSQASGLVSVQLSHDPSSPHRYGVDAMQDCMQWSLAQCAGGLELMINIRDAAGKRTKVREEVDKTKQTDLSWFHRWSKKRTRFAVTGQVAYSNESMKYSCEETIYQITGTANCQAAWMCKLSCACLSADPRDSRFDDPHIAMLVVSRLHQDTAVIHGPLLCGAGSACKPDGAGLPPAGFMDDEFEDVHLEQQYQNKAEPNVAPGERYAIRYKLDPLVQGTAQGFLAGEWASFYLRRFRAVLQSELKVPAASRNAQPQIDDQAWNVEFLQTCHAVIAELDALPQKFVPVNYRSHLLVTCATDLPGIACMPPSEELIITADQLDQFLFTGEWLKVFRPDKQEWYYTEIRDFNDITGMCTAVYESEEAEELLDLFTLCRNRHLAFCHRIYLNPGALQKR